MPHRLLAPGLNGVVVRTLPLIGVALHSRGAPIPPEHAVVKALLRVALVGFLSIRRNDGDRLPIILWVVLRQPFADCPSFQQVIQ